MAKMNFFGDWKVLDSASNPSDVPAGAICSIGDRADDKITIGFRNFGADYPASQSGVYQSNDTVVATFSDQTMITFSFPNPGDYTEIHASVEDVGTLEVGEWGAEACPPKDV